MVEERGTVVNPELFRLKLCLQALSEIYNSLQLIFQKGIIIKNVSTFVVKKENSSNINHES